MNRLCPWISRVVDAPWKMYPVGLLFGLGFDTATEVALLAISAAAPGEGIPIGLILLLPSLFTAGMVRTASACHPAWHVQRCSQD